MSSTHVTGRLPCAARMKPCAAFRGTGAWGCSGERNCCVAPAGRPSVCPLHGSGQQRPSSQTLDYEGCAHVCACVCVCQGAAMLQSQDNQAGDGHGTPGSVLGGGLSWGLSRIERLVLPPVGTRAWHPAPPASRSRFQPLPPGSSTTLLQGVSWGHRETSWS